MVYLATPHPQCSLKHQLSFRSTIHGRTKWLQGAIKLVGRLPPVPLPEYNPENLPDIETEEHTLPPDPGFTPPAPATEEGEGANTERGAPRHKHRKPNPLVLAASTTTVESLPDLTEDSHVISRGQSSGAAPPIGLKDTIQRMLHAD